MEVTAMQMQSLKELSSSAVWSSINLLTFIFHSHREVAFLLLIGLFLIMIESDRKSYLVGNEQ
jgi:hypothetical protein